MDNTAQKNVENFRQQQNARPKLSLVSSQDRSQASMAPQRISASELGNLTPQATPNMNPAKPSWEVRQPQPKINPEFTGHLKAYGHNVPQTPARPQDPYKQARQIGARLRKDGLQDPQTPSAAGKPQSEVRKAGQSLRKAGLKSPDYNRQAWQKSAQNINQSLNKNQRGWNVSTRPPKDADKSRQQRQPQKQIGMER